MVLTKEEYEAYNYPYGNNKEEKDAELIKLFIKLFKSGYKPINTKKSTQGLVRRAINKIFYKHFFKDFYLYMFNGDYQKIKYMYGNNKYKNILNKILSRYFKKKIGLRG